MRWYIFVARRAATSTPLSSIKEASFVILDHGQTNSECRQFHPMYSKNEMDVDGMGLRLTQPPRDVMMNDGENDEGDE
jgi:hypothetical protein